MIIIWGRKIRRRHHGRRANFCPICRDVRAFRVTEVRSYPHLYYVTVGFGRAEAYERSCESCRLSLEAENEDITESIRDRHAVLDDLIARTNPKVADRWGSRLAMERRLAARQLTAEEREALVLEPFVLLAPEVELRKATTHLDWVSGLFLLLTVAATIGWIVYVNSPSASWVHPDHSVPIGIGVFAAFGVAALVAMFGDARRFARRVTLSKLVRALHPLGPTTEELERALAVCRARDLALGRLLKPAEVHDAIAAHVPHHA